MNETFNDILDKIDIIYNSVMKANINELLDINYLTNLISIVGLQSEGDRRHPSNQNIHLYGDDVKYMNIVNNTGMWQIPRQLSEFLIKLVSLDNVSTFLDIGTCSGITITIISIYLLRFGIKHIETVDVIKYLNDDLKNKWIQLNLPIKYILIPIGSCYKDYVTLTNYDVIFIDGHHDYEYVSTDYKAALNMTTKICFHDINDCFCIDVVKLWNEIKNSKKYKNAYEFTYHSHNLKLMGIGLLEL